MKKTIIGITVVGKDREGIVAQFTNFVFQNNGNVEKVNQNVIKGLFGMYLDVSFTSKINFKQLNSNIQKLGKKLRMEISTHSETNTEKSIAVFVTKEEHCLKEILSSRRAIKGKISVIVGTERSLASLAKKAKIPFVVVEDRSQEKAEEKLLKICKKYQVKFLINDNPKIAKKINADGCDLGQKDMNALNARKILKNKIIGVTCHNSLYLAKKAILNGANYLDFGAFYTALGFADALRGISRISDFFSQYCASRMLYARFPGFIFSKISILAKTASGKAPTAFSWCGKDPPRNSAPKTPHDNIDCSSGSPFRDKNVFWGFGDVEFQGLGGGGSTIHF